MIRKLAIVILIGILVAGLTAPSMLQLAARERADKAYNHDNLIRLHVIANSDDPRDQELKYRVRDAIVAALRPEMLRLRSRAEAEALLVANRDKITRIAQQTIADRKCAYPARVEIGDFAFPARAYGDLVLPAGDYRALRVVLGQGAGSNWWCVLFPPLCFVDVSGNGIRTGDPGGDLGETLARGPSPAMREEMNPVAPGGNVRLRLRIMDWLETESEHVARLFSS